MYRVFKYMTRPMLFAAERERRGAGLRRRTQLPDFHELSMAGKYVVTMSYPFKRGLGDGIPFVRCFILWPEGGLAWSQDVTVDRWRMMPTMVVENPHAYRYELEGDD